MKKTALKADGRVIIPECSLALGFFERFMGLMGRSGLPESQAVFFPKCNSIHTFFMRFPIDVIFVGEDGKVVEIIEELKPWRMLVPRRAAKHAVEFAPKRTRALGITVGQKLDWES